MKISVVGAYGYTGSLICQELENAGIGFSVFGRNEEKLNALKTELKFVDTAMNLDLRDSKDISELVNLSDLVINCAGPFTEESNILVEQMAKSGKVYIDITGEVGFVKNSREQYHETAVNSHSLILHGCAFESLLADLAIHSLDAEQSIKSVRTFYYFSQNMVSPGTKMTMKLDKYRKSLKIKNKLWTECDFKLDQLKLTQNSEEKIAVPYPLPEVAFSNWNFNADEVSSFLLVDSTEAKFIAVKSLAEGDPKNELDRIRLIKRSGPSDSQRAEQKSEIIVNVNYADNSEETVVLKSSDMYLTTAKAVVLAAQKITKNRGELFGVISPGKLFTNQEEETLNELGVSIEKTSKIKMDHV